MTDVAVQRVQLVEVVRPAPERAVPGPVSALAELRQLSGRGPNENDGIRRRVRSRIVQQELLAGRRLLECRWPLNLCWRPVDHLGAVDTLRPLGHSEQVGPLHSQSDAVIYTS